MLIQLLSLISVNNGLYMSANIRLRMSANILLLSNFDLREQMMGFF